MRVCVRGFSEGKSEASKRATNFGLAKTSDFFYTVLANRFFYPNNNFARSLPILFNSDSVCL
ncbi:hypothetical protein DI383_14540 [Flavobacteriaceae bacterium LYZ1037]|nr:hypothetical protein DI383_14540 [Flavobacteriaceae bacterium LYZ1037]